MQTESTRVIAPESRVLTIKISLSAIYIALGVLLSYINPFKDIVILGAKINPFAHFINAIAGVTLGPIYAIFIALIIASIRFSLGWGTILAFPGGMTGALVVGIIAKYVKIIKPNYRIYTALTEPIGTVFIGGTIAAFILGTPFYALWWLFALSSIVGAVLGVVILLMLLKQPQINQLIIEQTNK